MARVEAQSVAGFYALPQDQVPRIAALLDLPEVSAGGSGSGSGEGAGEDSDDGSERLAVNFCDPCAGEGEAIYGLMMAVTEPLRLRAQVRDRASTQRHRQQIVDRARSRAESRGEAFDEAVYRQEQNWTEEARDLATYLDEVCRLFGVELEARRYDKLKQRMDSNRHQLLHGDALCVPFERPEGGGVSILYLNPPYEPSKQYEREEERFLRRYLDVLAPGGIAILVFPYYALSASAKTLAVHFEDVACYKLATGGVPDLYKRVVVLARKRGIARITSDEEIEALVRRWAASVDSCPELPEAGKPHRRPRYTVPLRRNEAWNGADVLDGWKVQPVDMAAIASQIAPWHWTNRRGDLLPVATVLPPEDLSTALHRTFEIANVARPAHVAAGLASGLFNGQRIEPDELSDALGAEAPKPLPPLLIKGVFDREWQTVEEKTNKDGEKTSEVQVQAPRLVVTVLDLHSHTYHTLRQDASATGTREVALMTVGDLLRHYGKSLSEVMERQCKVLYDPRRDAADYTLVPTARKLYTAQAHAVRGILAVLRHRGDVRAPILIGEIGCLRGDTMIHDPVTDTSLTVVERYRRAEPFHVWALSPQGTPVVAAAMPPVKYPVTQMVKVTLDDGSFVVVTPAHRFWDGKGWIKASEVALQLRQPGSETFHLPTSSVDGLRVRARDASRWSRTTPGSLGGCLHDRCSRGERLPSEGGSDQAPAPSRDGAPGRTLYGSREGAPEQGSGCSRSCRRCARQTTQDSEDRLEAPHLELFLPPRESHPSSATGSSRVLPRSLRVSDPLRTASAQSLAVPQSMLNEALEQMQGEQFRIVGGTPARGRTSNLQPSRSARSSARPGASDRSATAALASGLSAPPSAPPVRGDNDLTENQTRQVISVEPVDAENYYDFHVPVFNNYWAGGIWHHNSGKSTVSITAAVSHGAKRPLVFCPPHLLTSWKNEAASVFPEAEFRVLDSVSAVDAIARIPQDKLVISVLSRETAKLSHRLEGTSFSCPRCGRSHRSDPETLAKKRAQCEGRAVTPSNVYAKALRRMSVYLRAYGQSEYLKLRLPRLLRGGEILARKTRVRLDKTYETPAFSGLPDEMISEVLHGAVADIREHGWGAYNDFRIRQVLLWSLLLLSRGGQDAGIILETVDRLFDDKDTYDNEHNIENLLLLVPPGGALGLAHQAVAKLPKASYISAVEPSAYFASRYKDLHDKNEVHLYSKKLAVEEGRITFDGVSVQADGGLVAVGRLLQAIESLATYEEGPVCGERLYQSVPDPRRYPLAKYISRRHKHTFDFVIIDEAHEAGNADSAQSTAAHRLTAMGLPMLLMTGSIMNGYAESLFANFWATDKEFRQEFDRREESAFVDRYGYKKRLVQDKEEGKVVAFGTQSDRVERSERTIGSAPGVLPLFLFNRLLKGAITLHKADLRIELPRLVQERRAIEVVEAPAGSTAALLYAEYSRVLKKLTEAIKRDRYDEELAGKLFGQLSEMPSYLDRATRDVGNGTSKTAFEVRYPESVGSKLVDAAQLLSEDVLLPKEEAMLDLVEREVRDNRRVMVFGWHTDKDKGDILGRLQRILQDRIGGEIAVLRSEKVPTAKRQDWIDKHVVGKKAPVMVVNPVCVQTGLNNLTWFSTIWQHENPACNPIVDRQSIGRIDRIGQKLEARVFRAYYAGTLQEKMHDLLMHKVAVSTSVDGLDPESAMLAAGVEQDTFVAGLSLGKALWKMIEDDLDKGSFEERPTLQVVRRKLR